MTNITKFYTVHRPKEHSAHQLDNSILVPPQGTEIELVRKLMEDHSIDIKKYKYHNNRGDEKDVVRA
jgi:hypothetical protein